MGAVRVLMALAVGCGLWGCTSNLPGTCDRDSDCSAEEYCTQNICVLRSAGSGSTGGSSGGSVLYSVSIATNNVGNFVGGGDHPVTARVTPAELGAPEPGSVVLSAGARLADGGCGGGQVSLSRMDGGGSWVGTWNVQSSSDVPIRLCARAMDSSHSPAGSGTLDLLLDVTPPQVSFSFGRAPGTTTGPDAGFATAYVRDEDPVPVVLAVSDGGSPTSVFLSVDGVDAGIGPLNLQSLPLESTDHSFKVVAHAVDAVGNSSTFGPSDLNVTRWAWVSPVAVDSMRIPPAVGGLIYVGGYNVYGLYYDGGIAWSSGGGSVPVSDLALGPSNNSVLFVMTSAESHPTTLYSLDPATGNHISSFVNVNNFPGTLATVTNSGHGESAVLSTLDPGLKVSGFAANGSLLASSTSTSASMAGQLFTSGLGGWVYMNDGAQYRLDPFNYYGTTSQVFQGSAIPRAIASTLAASRAGAMFVLDDGTVGFDELGAPNGYYSRSDAGYADGPQVLMTADRDGIVSDSVNGLLKWIRVGLPDAFGPAGASGSNGMLLASNHLYAASASKLFAIDDSIHSDVQHFGRIVWTADLGASGWYMASPPSIYCGRNGLARLVFAVGASRVASLVIDDSGLRQGAPWPMPRHDQRNTSYVGDSYPMCSQ